MIERMGFRSLLYLVLIVLLTANPLLAQNNPTRPQSLQVVDGDLTLTVSYPADWAGAKNSDNSLILASTSGALKQVQGGGNVPSGEIALLILPPSILSAVGLPHDASPDQVIKAYLQASNAQGTVQTSSDFAVPAATALMADPRNPNQPALLGALALPAGTVVFTAIPGDPLDATVVAILNTITLSASSSQTALPSAQSTAESTPSTQQSVAIEAVPTVFDVPQSTSTTPLELSVKLPTGWVSQYYPDYGLLYLGNSQSALDKETSNAFDQFTADEVGMSIALPRAVQFTGTPEDVLKTVRAQTKTHGDIQTDPGFAVPTAYGQLIDDKYPEQSSDMYALAFPDGMLLITVQPINRIDPTMLGILRSIQYRAPAQATAESTAQATIEPTEQVTVESTAQATAEPTVQATSEPTAQVTVEPTVQATPEPTAVAEYIRQWAISADGSSQYSDIDWSFTRATGKPDTTTCDDNPTAWASYDKTTSEYLRLTFPQPVIPTQINIYETFNPGAIIGVGLGSTANPDQVMPLPNSADPPGHTPCPGVFTVNVTDITTPVDMVVIRLDQSLTGNWNEIDAVQLVGTPPS